MLPDDVLQTIVELVAEDGREAFTIGRVCSTWMNAVTTADFIWTRLIRLTWPKTRASSCKFSVFRARMMAAKSMEPALPKTLHPIEDCDFAFKCPLLVESLRKLPDDQASSTGSAVYFCDVCQEKVYEVSSQEEWNLRASQGRCVMAQPPKTMGGIRKSEYRVCMLDTDGVSAHKLLRLLRNIIFDMNEEKPALRMDESCDDSSLLLGGPPMPKAPMAPSSFIDSATTASITLPIPSTKESPPVELVLSANISYDTGSTTFPITVIPNATEGPSRAEDLVVTCGPCNDCDDLWLRHIKGRLQLDATENGAHELYQHLSVKEMNNGGPPPPPMMGAPMPYIPPTLATDDLLPTLAPYDSSSIPFLAPAEPGSD